MPGGRVREIGNDITLRTTTLLIPSGKEGLKMTRDEFNTIIKILSTADGGCTACVRSLCALFLHKFPEWTVKDIANVKKYREIDNEDLMDIVEEKLELDKYNRYET